VRLCRLAIIANPIAEDQPLLLVARLTQVVSNEDFRLVPGPFLNAVAIWRGARAQRLLRIRIRVFVCVLVIYDQNDSVPHLLLSKKFFFLLTLLLLLHEIHTYRRPQGGLLLTTAVLHQRLLVRVLGCRRRRVRRREHFSSVFFLLLVSWINLLTREDTKKKEKVPSEKKKIALFIRKKRADVALRSRALLVRRGSVRAELEDLAEEDDDDDDDDDAKKKSLKLSWVGLYKTLRTEQFFFLPRRMR